MMLLVNEPLLDGNEKNYLAECIDTGWISSGGPFVTRFEKLFAERMGRKHGIAVCNGSCALEVAIASLGIGAGDEVIVPSFTIISCAHAIIRAGATPVLIDTDRATWNMCTDTIEAHITPNTKAIMAVHIYGLPVQMDVVMDIAVRYGLHVIEDAAEMHGQMFNGKPCGSFGTLSTFSFYANKIITTGEGGMVLTDDDTVAEKCRSLRNLSFGNKHRFIHEASGWNFRMTNLQAAIGLAQLERLDAFIVKKREIGAAYQRRLSGHPMLQLPLVKTGYAENIYWVFGIILNEKARLDVTAMMKQLAVAGIESRPFFCGMHEQPVFHAMGLFKNLKLPGAEYLTRSGFYLPSGLGITSEQQQMVTDTLLNILDNG